MLAAPEHVRGLQFVPSMALGALVLAPTITAALTCLPGSSIGFVQAGGGQPAC